MLDNANDGFGVRSRSLGRLLDDYQVPVYNAGASEGASVNDYDAGTPANVLNVDGGIRYLSAAAAQSAQNASVGVDVPATAPQSINAGAAEASTPPIVAPPVSSNDLCVTTAPVKSATSTDLVRVASVTPLPPAPATTNWLLYFGIAGVAGLVWLANRTPAGLGCPDPAPVQQPAEEPKTLGRPPRRQPKPERHLKELTIS